MKSRTRWPANGAPIALVVDSACDLPRVFGRHRSISPLPGLVRADLFLDKRTITPTGSTGSWKRKERPERPPSREIKPLAFLGRLYDSILSSPFRKMSGLYNLPTLKFEIPA
jgi:hypothetical protein